MLEAISILGKYEITKKTQNSIEHFLPIEKAKLKNIKKIICIVFEKCEEEITYNHIHIEDYDPSKNEKYLYKTTPHNRYDVTPTSKIKKSTKGKGKEKTVDIDKVIESVKKRLLNWFENHSKDNKNSLITSLKEILETKEKEIFEDFANKYEELRVYKVEKNKTIDEQKNSILTIKIIEDGKEKYIGDFEIFKNIFEEETEKKFYYRKSFGKRESKGEGICCICKNSGEVFGFALPFSFYTVDKKGFAPEFIREDSWKRLPICKECAKYLTIGREFMDNYLLKKFYHGYQFYIIPHFVLGKIDDSLIEEIKRQEKNEDYEGLLIEDDYFIEPIKERGSILNLIFMFIEPKQGGNFDIVRYVEDVPPSWIKRLYDTLKQINNLLIFKEGSLKKMGVVGKETRGDLKNIDHKGTRIGGLIETFFPKSKETGVYSKYFIDIIGDILSQRPINKNLLIKAFIREIRNRHVNENSRDEKILALKSLMLLLFLNKLNLIKERGESMEKEESRITDVEKFMNDYSVAFDIPEKKAVFLEGVLAKFLLDIQFVNRRSTPFRTKLYSLKLDEIKIKKLLPEIVEKLREYKVVYPWLEELVSKYLIEAENNGWRLSKDEISYYFALGLNLGGLFKEKDEKGGSEND